MSAQQRIVVAICDRQGEDGVLSLGHDSQTRKEERPMIPNSSLLILPLLAHQLFGEQLPKRLDELNEVLAA